jgi:hypothetical protein
MAPGLYNATSISIENITGLAANPSDPVGFLIGVNTTVFDGWMFFMLLLTAMFILFFSFQTRQNQPLNNLLYSSVICTVLSFLLRAITMVYLGVEVGLLSDLQMWVFPLATATLSAIIWAIKD